MRVEESLPLHQVVAAECFIGKYSLDSRAGSLVTGFIKSLVIERAFSVLKKILIRGLLVDPMPNSLNLYHKNCMTDIKENMLMRS